LNIGGTLLNLTDSALEGSGRARILDYVPLFFSRGTEEISGKVIKYSWSPDRTLIRGFLGIENRIVTCFLVTDKNSLTCFCIPGVTQFGTE
jgi:hypothetical protein